MRLLLGSLLLLVALASFAVPPGQTTPSVRARKPAAWKRYCQPDSSFCFKYPNSWSMLGEVFDGNGVVIAPPQKEDRSLWDAITVALVVPPPQADDEPLGLNGVIDRATSGLRERGQSFETLQRQERTVDHQPAQMLKARYHEKSSGRDWIEEMVFIEGPDNEIYSVVLKCAPQNLARLEPVLNGVLAGWTLPESATGPPDEKAPKKAAPKKATPPAPSQ
jgi:hypothetical protein